MEDYKILRGNDWINDNIIYAAQSILKQQFGVDGLQSTQCGRNLSFRVIPRNAKYVQLLHANDNHWITVSNIDFYAKKGIQDRALIFDSCVPMKIGHNVKMQICAFVRPATDVFRFDVLNIMPQHNSYDCGLFAIANATALLHGTNPVRCVWDTSIMRRHLVKCLEKKIMEPFPVLRERRVPFGSAVKHSEEEAIHCLCRMPYEKSSVDMIQCSLCKIWYHSSCINIASVDDYKTKRWFCVKCDCLMKC